MDKQKLFEIGMKKRNGELSQSWDELAKGHFVSGEAFRRWIRRQIHKPEQNVPEYKETVEIHSDGAQSSNKLLRMSIEDTKDANYLLRAHGYDVTAWELVSARSNIWNAYSKQDGIMQLYASKITVKPRKAGYDFEELVNAARSVPSATVKEFCSLESPGGLLELAFYDMHFGISTLEDYWNTMSETFCILNRRSWDEVLIPIGQDMFHNDSFRGQTANGTQIEAVDMPRAWRDSATFFDFVIRTSIECAKHVKVIYSKGNHDESMSWAFAQYVKARFPQIEVDDRIIERKAHVYGDIFIGVTHGDKSRKDVDRQFQVDFPLEWANAKVREIHMGHLHKEDAADIYGAMVRTISTRNKTDKWHADNGYIGAHKRFMLFEYSKEALKSIHYV